jgi:hypothetical protein
MKLLNFNWRGIFGLPGALVAGLIIKTMSCIILIMIPFHITRQYIIIPGVILGIAGFWYYISIRCYSKIK